MAMINQQVRLPDGRQLGYNQYGSPDGTPLFYFHGAPSARVEFALFGDDALLHSLNVRLIAADRPGMGLSDFQPQRRLLDWPADVLALAGHLGIERFSILAYSLGGPYGLACAYAIPERLNQVGIVSGAALFTMSELMVGINEGTRRYINLPRENPRAARLFLWVMGVSSRLAPSKFISNAARVLPEPDAAIFDDPDIQRGFIALIQEALRQGRQGAFHESLLAITDWGFRLQDIQAPIYLWHGALDQNIPAEMARHAAKTLSKCETQFYSAEGHLSLFKKNAGKIIRALVA